MNKLHYNSFQVRIVLRIAGNSVENEILIQSGYIVKKCWFKVDILWQNIDRRFIEMECIVLYTALCNLRQFQEQIGRNGREEMCEKASKDRRVYGVDNTGK